MPPIHRTYKASVFADYFADKKRLIEAYNAIAGTITRKRPKWSTRRSPT